MRTEDTRTAVLAPEKPLQRVKRGAGGGGGRKPPTAVGAAPEPFSLVVSLPIYRLSPNGSRNRHERARLAKRAREESANACQVIPAASRPLWPTGKVLVTATVVLPKGQKKLDQDGAIGLLKATIDGTQGMVIANDSQVTWAEVRWERDALLLGGIVRLEFSEVRDGER